MENTRSELSETSKIVTINPVVASVSPPEICMKTGKLGKTGKKRLKNVQNIRDLSNEIGERAL